MAAQVFHCPGDSCTLSVDFYSSADPDEVLCPHPECKAIMDYRGYPSGAFADCSNCGHGWIA